MKAQIYRMLMMTALVAGIGVTAARAQAQEYKGTFDLTQEITWAGNVYAPGHYTVHLRYEASGSPFVHLIGPGGETILLAGTREPSRRSDSAELKLVAVNGTWAVREFNTGDYGRTFTFHVPRPSHPELESKRRAAPQESVVSISSAQ